ncbi:kinase-like domain-containing protein [Rhizophagus clarus]|uniref:Kinase-like domain-containing protein n=1 Tax=Rhizophagus clarus TaxID=94130 RepID=A0A8H3M7D9_9GLOM|nr:kinase-like domain-containing protein [Rhizophagus clarus]
MAIWLKSSGEKEVAFKCLDNLNESLNGFLNEWDCHEKCLGERPEIIESTPQCYVDLMKKCWNEDPLERPTAKKVGNIIANWIFCPYDEDTYKRISNDKISEELKSDIMEFINAPIGNNNLITKSHPQAYYTSRLLDFTSKKVNETLKSECLDFDNIKSLDIKTDKN